jgi:DNA polymerase-3 subunit gamma/tau
LARAANCQSTTQDKPCNECANCLAAGRDIATDLIEIDAASNTGVDNIREIIERAQFSPAVWDTKFYIIDEVHMLSVSAFNALLKTLEEPPPHVAFILATTEVHKVPATVASRCQRFDFRRVPLKAMVDRLRWVCDHESVEVEEAALELVARQSTGSLRDALSLLDQLLGGRDQADRSAGYAWRVRLGAGGRFCRLPGGV